MIFIRNNLGFQQFPTKGTTTSNKGKKFCLFAFALGGKIQFQQQKKKKNERNQNGELIQVEALVNGVGIKTFECDSTCIQQLLWDITYVYVSLNYETTVLEYHIHAIKKYLHILYSLLVMQLSWNITCT